MMIEIVSQTFPELEESNKANKTNRANLYKIFTNQHF